MSQSAEFRSNQQSPRCREDCLGGNWGRTFRMDSQERVLWLLRLWVFRTIYPPQEAVKLLSFRTQGFLWKPQRASVGRCISGARREEPFYCLLLFIQFRGSLLCPWITFQTFVQRCRFSPSWLSYAPFVLHTIFLLDLFNPLSCIIKSHMYWAYDCDRETVLTYSLWKIRIYRHAIKYHQYPKHSGINMLTFPQINFPIFHRCVYLYVFIKVYVTKIIIILYRLFCNLLTN